MFIILKLIDLLKFCFRLLNIITPLNFKKKTIYIYILCFWVHWYIYDRKWCDLKVWENDDWINELFNQQWYDLCISYIQSECVNLQQYDRSIKVLSSVASAFCLCKINLEKIVVYQMFR